MTHLQTAVGIGLVGTLALQINSPVVADNEPVGDTFTYQGELMHEGEPVTGEVDMIFRLYDSPDPEASNHIGPELTIDDFEIEGGRFTIDLDFGAGAFTGEERWLEVEVDESILSPRQPIMPSPHAMVATTAANVPTKAVVGSYGGITGVGTLDGLRWMEARWWARAATSPPDRTAL